jgi:hypothetical protein
MVPGRIQDARKGPLVYDHGSPQASRLSSALPKSGPWHPALARLAHAWASLRIQIPSIPLRHRLEAYWRSIPPRIESATLWHAAHSTAALHNVPKKNGRRSAPEQSTSNTLPTGPSNSPLTASHGGRGSAALPSIRGLPTVAVVPGWKAVVTSWKDLGKNGVVLRFFPDRGYHL